jgi:hypothetical protein
MHLENRDKRDSLIYDPQIKGYDNTFWANVSGTPTIASSKIRYNAATSASFMLFEFVELLNFSITVPAAPTSGDSRRWGLLAPATGTVSAIGAVYFDITGAVFTVHVVDSAGNDQSQTITWSTGNWDGHAIVYGIAWEADRVQFWVNGSIVATFGAISNKTIPFTALPLYIKNGNSDNMDVGYVDVRGAAGMI